MLCCGRFTANDGLLYHAREGRPPFHVLGPALPAEWEEGQKFSIYRHTECETLADLVRVREHAQKISSLTLVGDWFDDQALVVLPELPHLELLALSDTKVGGVGLTTLLRIPTLQILRIGLARNDSFRIPQLDTKHVALEVLDIDDPPRRAWGFRELVGATRKLRSLSFQARGELFVDGDCPRTVETLRVQATRIIAGLKLPKAIDSVYAHLSEMEDREIGAWLGSAKHIGALDLSDTPITDAFAEALPKRFGLRYLNVVNTRVTEAAVRRIARANPTLKMFPNLEGE